MSWRIFLFSFWCCFVSVLSESALSVTPCRRSDSICINNLGNVLYLAAIQGNPKLGIETLDPFYQEYFEGNLSIIKYTLKNSTLTGFKDCEVANTIISANLSNIRFEMHCPVFRMIGLYTIDGQLIIIPIQGNGDFRLVITDYRFNIDAELKFTQNVDNKTYVKFKNFKFDAELIGNFDIDLENLFNGRKELAEPVMKFIRNNGKAVTRLLQEPLVTVNIKKIVINFNKYLRTLPVENIITD